MPVGGIERGYDRAALVPGAAGAGGEDAGNALPARQA